MRPGPFSAAISALAAVIASAAIVAPASATFQGRNGRLVYATGGGELDYVVWTVNPNGTGHRRLIGPDRSRFFRGLADPQWSADGKHLLFGGHHHLDRAAQSLWYSSASGKRVRRIPLGLGGTGTGPDAIYLYGWAWNPDGRHVAFAAGRGLEQSRVYTIALDGRHRKALRRGSWPEWSNDGRHIAFSRIRSGSSPYGGVRTTIAVMRPDGSGFRRLTTSTRDSSPTMSPDGRRVVFVREFNGLPTPRPEWRAEWRVVDITGRHDSLLATHYFWGDADQMSLAPRYCAPEFAPNGESLGALRTDASGASFAAFNLGDQTERTVFPLAQTLWGDCSFAWQPLQPGATSGEPRRPMKATPVLVTMVPSPRR